MVAQAVKQAVVATSHLAHINKVEIGVQRINADLVAKINWAWEWRMVSVAQQFPLVGTLIAWPSKKNVISVPKESAVLKECHTVVSLRSESNGFTPACHGKCSEFYGGGNRAASAAAKSKLWFYACPCVPLHYRVAECRMLLA